MIFNLSGGGGSGGTLTVKAPAGVTVKVTNSDETKTKKKTADQDGYAIFKGLDTGWWMLEISDGNNTAQKPVNITADYSEAISFFSATIIVTYPVGSTCTATDGVTTLTAPDTSGTWECIVPNAGTWIISSTASSFQEEVTITTSGQVAKADVTKLYLQKGSSINYPTNFTNVKTSILDNGVKYMQNGSSSRATAHFGPLSLTGATKLYVKLTAGYAHASPVPCICVSTSLLTGHPSADLKRFAVGSADSNAGVGVTSGTYVMDISGYSGEYYVALDWEGKAGNNTYLTTEAIWLEV